MAQVHADRLQRSGVGGRESGGQEVKQLPFSLSTLNSQLSPLHHGLPSKLVMSPLHHGLPSKLVMSPLHHGLPSKLVMSPLHHGLPSKLVMSPLHHGLPSKLVMSPLHHGLPAYAVISTSLPSSAHLPPSELRAEEAAPSTPRATSDSRGD